MPTAKELNLSVGDIVKIAMPVIGLIFNDPRREDSGIYFTIYDIDERRGTRAEIIKTNIGPGHGTRIKLLEDEKVEYRKLEWDWRNFRTPWENFPIVTRPRDLVFNGKKGEEKIIVNENYVGLTLCERKSA